MPQNSNQQQQPIAHVSDTALWVAVYRAMETNRKDALFRDPYADRLAGERGREIARHLERRKSGAWWMITRTAVLDEMIEGAIQAGTNTVVNLAAGLDTRPYRLNLSPALRWIEVDFPDILSYKEKTLADEQPKCSLERVALDLTDQTARRTLFDRINRDGNDVLVITEGLLVFLKPDNVVSLAADLRAEPTFRWWVADVLTPELLAWLLRDSYQSFSTGDVRMQFAPENGADFFGKYGWKPVEVRTVLKESRRLKREMPLAWLFRLIMPLAPKKVRESTAGWIAIMSCLNEADAREVRRSRNPKHY